MRKNQMCVGSGLCAFSAAALVGLSGTALGQQTWQEKSHVVQTQNVWHVTGAGINLGQIELTTGRRTHDFFKDGAGDRVDFLSLTKAANAGDAHPTQVCGIMAGNTATYKGAAPDARLQWADWTVPPGGTNPDLSTNFLQKMNFFLAAPRASIINMSAEVSLNDPGDSPALIALRNQLRSEHQRMADWTVTQGQLFIAAAGNSGRDGTNTVSAPGSGYNVLTVGGTGNFDNPARGDAPRNWDQVGRYSSRGPVNAPPWSGGGGDRIKPDLVAPGFSTLTADNTADNATTSAIQGTSFAAPQVSGTAAMLFELSGANAIAKDPRVMRSILMNSTNKTVKNDAGTRWDELGLGSGATNMSSVLGTGRLDAIAAARQMAAGQSIPTFGVGSVGGAAQNTGWDLGTLVGTGVGSSNDYLTQKPLRKGTYITATLSWNRNMAVRNGGAAPGDYGYDQLNNLDIGVSKEGSISTFLSRANSTDTTNEHLVYKVGKADADRTKYYIRAYQTSHDSITRPDETYGLSWRSVEAPNTGSAVAAYNGNFNPGLSAPVDDGWYSVLGTPRIGERPWSVADPVSGLEDAAYAMELKDGDQMGQELVTPSSELGSYFDISITYGFTNAAGKMEILLGGINLLEWDNQAGDQLLASDGALNTARVFSTHVDFHEHPEIWAAMWGGNFTELAFSMSMGGLGYVDNISYVPAPGCMALLSVGMVAMRRRRA